MTDNYNPDLLNNYLATYYEHLYPTKLMFKWLSYGNDPKDYMERREIAFIFENEKHHRFQTYRFPFELQSELVKRCPYKIDIGAVYNAPAKFYKSIPDFRPVARELVFDIDLTDYDDIRNCCSKATVCNKCWKFIIIAARVLNFMLIKHFGFRHMLWLFSGRRGMHCWVADKLARELENIDRSAIAAYSTFRLKEFCFDQEVVHPYIEEACQTILQSKEVDQIVVEQCWLADKELQQLVEKYCPDKATQKCLLEHMSRFEDQAARWQHLKNICDERSNEKALSEGKRIPKPTIYMISFLRAFLLDRLNPRLDQNVTIATNHLLKSPFCVHPKTGAIAVPFCLDSISEFRIENVPRVDKLVAELNSASSMDIDEPLEDRKLLAYKRSALLPFIETFEKFIEGLSVEQKKALI